MDVQARLAGPHDAPYRELIDALPASVLLLDEQHRVVLANAAAGELLGCSAPELAGLSARDLLHPDEQDEAMRAADALADGEQRALQQRLVRRDGDVITSEGRVRALRLEDGRRYYVVTHTDATERLSALEALRTSEARFRALVETARSGFMLIDGEGCIHFANSTLASMLGYELDELLELRADELLPDDVREPTLARRAARLRGEAVDPWYRGRRRRKDGSEIVVDVAVSVVPLGGEAPRLLIELRDVTAQARSEEALRRTERRYRELVEHASNAIVTTDVEGRYVLWNTALLQLTGYSDEDLSAMRAGDLTAPEHRAQALEQRAARMRGDAAPRSYQTVVVTKDGRRIPALTSVTVLEDEGGPSGTLVEIVDLREQQALQERLLHAQKSEALSTLVAGVAHDFNNLLTAIAGSVEIANRDLGANQWLDNARQATERAAELVRQLRQYSRREPPQRQPVDLSVLAREAASLVEPSLDPRVSLEFEAAPEVPEIEADYGQILQVVMNLLANARDAHGERLALEGDSYRPFIAIRIAPAAPRRGHAPMVEVAVVDNGPGVAPEVRERIFDPFFTTKEVGRGSGLGLATAYGIAYEHGGTLTVESEPGHGSEFRLALPASTPAPAGGASAAAPARPRTVLLADQNAIIRETAAGILEAAGYEVLLAPDGASAEALLRERTSAGGTVDLLVLDDLPPSGERWSVLRRIRREQPGVPVLLTSSHASREHARDEEAAGLLRKPYTSAALVEAVEAALRR